RIDSAHIVDRGTKLRAIDIDGVDFARYFQWEDDGVVNIDIDFPRLRRISREASIVIHTVHGDITAPIPLQKKHKK
ncbi:MAG: hypothetical protein NC311_18380, partial [Muribaculaceae bacterium]|nr:hypothetical protein [Muribaculaceae bacterium]